MPGMQHLIEWIVLSYDLVPWKSKELQLSCFYAHGMFFYLVQITLTAVFYQLKSMLSPSRFKLNSEAAFFLDKFHAHAFFLFPIVHLSDGWSFMHLAQCSKVPDSIEDMSTTIKLWPAERSNKITLKDYVATPEEPILFEVISILHQTCCALVMQNVFGRLTFGSLPCVLYSIWCP